MPVKTSMTIWALNSGVKRRRFFMRMRLPSDLQVHYAPVRSRGRTTVARLTGHPPNRVLHWLGLAGQHSAVVGAALIRNLHLTQVQIDELWTFIKKSKPTAE